MTRGIKTRCSGQWTEARFNSFIKSALRAASRRWAPISLCLKNARLSRGLYLCESCKQEVTTSVVIDGKRHKNIIVDHKEPIVPVTGWTNWNDCIERMFCEIDGLQAVCKACHDEKSKEETAERAVHRKAKKEKSDETNKR